MTTQDRLNSCTNTLVVNIATAAEMLGLSYPTLRRQINIGFGPPIIQLSNRRVGIRVSDLEKWVDHRPTQRSSASWGVKS